MMDKDDARRLGIFLSALVVSFFAALGGQLAQAQISQGRHNEKHISGKKKEKPNFMKKRGPDGAVPAISPRMPSGGMLSSVPWYDAYWGGKSTEIGVAWPGNFTAPYVKTELGTWGGGRINGAFCAYALHGAPFVEMRFSPSQKVELGRVASAYFSGEWALGIGRMEDFSGGQIAAMLAFLERANSPISDVQIAFGASSMSRRGYLDGNYKKRAADEKAAGCTFMVNLGQVAFAPMGEINLGNRDDYSALLHFIGGAGEIWLGQRTHNSPIGMGECGDRLHVFGISAVLNEKDAKDIEKARRLGRGNAEWRGSVEIGVEKFKVGKNEGYVNLKLSKGINLYKKPGQRVLLNRRF